MIQGQPSTLSLIAGFLLGFLMAKADEIGGAIVNMWREFWLLRRYKKAMKDPDVGKDFV